ncbi:anthrone oxygenase family protein [Agrococcus baldri]|uniref:Membrane protein n=1 Tax=Agrococcus baldri TaxID=153730 RepID=A0AA87RNW3_9MICO|nr:anthrone oxygenase family protein [Agrococcus baldri]GEK81372.1 membrane protein [Agrococcus baldri]
MLGTVVLVLAAVAAGVTAGVFFLYSNAIMPGLRRVDDRTFVGAFQAIDRAIVNPLFLVGGFFGTLLLSIAAALLHLGDGDVLWWAVAAAVLQAAVIVITGAVNVPRNDALKAAGPPDGIDASAARAAFDERRWVRWNHVRVLLSVAVVVCLAIALLGA